MKTICLVLFCFLVQGVAAQGVLPGDWGLNAYQIQDPELGEINYYVTQKGIDQDKPVLFMVSGVRGLPVMLVVSTGDQSLQLGSVPPDQIFSFADAFHVAFISKAGTPFCDTFMVDEINPMKNLEEYPPSETYIQNCGLNQFYSSIINRRMDADAGRITHQEAQEAIDGLLDVYKKIYADPESTEKWYDGHPYKRWGSFCNDIPLDHLVELDIPSCI